MSADLRAWRVTDPEAWNAFVEAAPYHAFPQLWEWGEVRAMGGWRPVRIAVGPSLEAAPVAGAQLLLRRLPLLGWHLAYAPRGPIGQLDDPIVREALIHALRAVGRAERIATVRADPEARLDSPFGAAALQPPWRAAPKVQPPTTRVIDLRVGEEALRAVGQVERIATVRADPEAQPDSPFGAAALQPPWRAAPKVQPPTTRVIDLRVGEEALRAGLKRKHRQYVNKAERAGIEIERFDGSTPPEVIGQALADFNRIYRLTADRAGFVARQAFYYERVWSIFAPTGRVRLSFAIRDGERVATLFHFTCGDRAVESYGGMTDPGAEARANYLLKFAAISDFANEGYAVYDMWGLATGGIRQFKEGFGGEEITYVGARDLALRAPIDAVVRVAIPAYGLAQRARLRLRGGHPREAAETA